MDNGANGALDGSADAPGVGQWMTYDELAELRGSDRMSAVKYALRRGWRRQRDNRRVARVYVPLDEWPSQIAAVGHGGAEAGPSLGIGFRANQPIEPMSEMRARADEVRAVERAMWRAQLVRQRERADNLERERDQLLIAVKDLQSRVTAVEARAEAADDDRRAAVARADAERARADVLDQAATAERARADTLQQQVEDTDATLASERARADALAERLRAISRLLAFQSSVGPARQ